MSKLIFTNRDKEVRAKEISKFVLGEKNPKTEYENSNKERFLELLKEKKIDLKKEDVVVLEIYKLLGGSILTEEQDAKIKARFKKAKAFAKVEKEEEEGVDDDDDDEKEEDDDE